MSPEPNANTGRGDYRAEPIVAKYTALVSTDVISSDLAVGGQAEGVRGTLQEAPGYVQVWPPRPLRAEVNSRTATDTLVLARLKTLFDFGAELADDEVGDVRRHMAGRWPELLDATTPQNGSKDGPFERIGVTAIVRANGDAEWEFERAPASGRPLPLNTEEMRGKRPELDLYIQNLVRADLEARLAVAP